VIVRGNAVKIKDRSEGARDPDPIRVVIADDHRLVRQELRNILEETEDIQLVGEAADGCQAVDLAGKLTPDVVLMDINMPRMDGVEATRLIRHQFPSVQVVGLSVNAAHFADALRWAGAAAVLNKDCEQARLIEAIRSSRSNRD
jgi:DNA-binding NarL/FixJ family response regulator